VADAPPSRSKAVVLNGCMVHLLAADQNADALQVAREGLAMARTLGDRDVEAAALGTIGGARVDLGDPGGIADLERCIALCEADGSFNAIAWQNNRHGHGGSSRRARGTLPCYARSTRFGYAPGCGSS
jgi:hypothetical protein